mmetsp:Transcript_55916/g.118919  ORF Transcript_55916/g.118919 Transcript_55916/m.118919 type:complete len:91 (-) Transcript_55916:329-601(-)
MRNLQASLTCSSPNSDKAASRFVKNNGFVDHTSSNSSKLAPALKKWYVFNKGSLHGNRTKPLPFAMFAGNAPHIMEDRDRALRARNDLRF